MTFQGYDPINIGDTNYNAITFHNSPKIMTGGSGQEKICKVELRKYTKEGFRRNFSNSLPIQIMEAKRDGNTITVSYTNLEPGGDGTKKEFTIQRQGMISMGEKEFRKLLSELQGAIELQVGFRTQGTVKVGTPTFDVEGGGSAAGQVEDEGEGVPQFAEDGSGNVAI